MIRHSQFTQIIKPENKWIFPFKFHFLYYVIIYVDSKAMEVIILVSITSIEQGENLEKSLFMRQTWFSTGEIGRYQVKICAIQLWFILAIVFTFYKAPHNILYSLALCLLRSILRCWNIEWTHASLQFKVVFFFFVLFFFFGRGGGWVLYSSLNFMDGVC